MSEKKILIAEDEKPMAKALSLKLEKEGFKVKDVCNGQEAIDALKKEEFDLVILDLIMPKMDGFTTLEKIKKDKLSKKVIVASNLSQEEDRERAKKLGAVDFLIKSDTPLSEIVKKIKKVLS